MVYNNVNTLEIQNLSKIYTVNKIFNKSKFTALKDLNLVLTPGLYAILGENGAGKSTLINIITGTLNQTEGKILYNNKTTRKLNDKFRKVLGFMPQQQALYENFTGRDFLKYMCALKDIKKENALAEVLSSAKAVNIEKLLDKKISSYSAGMKQRLLLANAFLGTPEILILDEPTVGLDPKERVNLKKIIKDKSKEAIIIFATHVVSDIENIADEIILLKDGEIIDKASVDSLIEKYAPKTNLETVYLKIFESEDS